jgi:hypothetical protein
VPLFSCHTISSRSSLAIRGWHLNLAPWRLAGNSREPSGGTALARTVIINSAFNNNPRRFEVRFSQESELSCKFRTGLDSQQEFLGVPQTPAAKFAFLHVTISVLSLPRESGHRRDDPAYTLTFRKSISSTLALPSGRAQSFGC